MIRSTWLFALTLSTLVGCGATAPAPVFPPKAVVDAATATGTVFEAGQAAGQIRAAEIHQGEATSETPRLRPSETGSSLYQYGYAVGMLQGAINAHDNIKGSFDAKQFMNFATINYKAMREVLRVLKHDPELAFKYDEVCDILERGIQRFQSLTGSYDVSEWQSFARQNRDVLERALKKLEP